ncbi:MAG: class II aldolase/adducin family protein [Sphaerochaetaceae bacterium]|jgi:rhamnose utilization protein RhaD (predicted bifunctional aldolase and dehydrogenase)|nr:class II aldolase/adducin family protein [Sphaerochaetaceae bacterium]MDD3163251.1 class II aldolase/adducin family protein [Sphaerochaetaceae bacterium]MDD4007390.1 class II aldolase/adducin family protein [Sphaerochaetaceae bacterium]MDD4396177.1 class II aldolase/adducin family protein [Sphaerochaetaceae bacterium]
MEGIEQLVETSRLYGSDARFVLLGGGNTSLKKDGIMWIKASGTQLGTIDEHGFVRMSLDKLAAIWLKSYPSDTKEREAAVLSDMMDARVEGETLRPSVEVLLHAFLPFDCVVHLHPALVNGMTCGQSGETACRSLFPEALWIPLVNPGFILASTVRAAYLKRKEETGSFAKVIFLQNHGVFVAGETFSDIKGQYSIIMDKLASFVTRQPNFEEVKPNKKRFQAASEAVSEYFAKPCIGILNRELSNRLSNSDSFYSISSAYTPDHIVYSGFKPLWIDDSVFKSRTPSDLIKAACLDYEKVNGVKPKVVAVQGTGAFCDGEKSASLFLDTMKVAAYTEPFGGPHFMDADQIDFIRHWEVESYRAKVSAAK